MASDLRPVLGLIFPPADRGVPEEGIAIYGERLRFVVTGLGIEHMTPAGFDMALSRIPEAARKLKQAGADAIELTGTSLTFHRGEAFNRELRDAVTAASACAPRR
jgi:arylmalonate decarboxylase